MNILLVSPKFPDTFFSYRHALKIIGKRAALPPLGLLTVAAMLPKGWNRRLADLNVGKLKAKDLAWADYAFISAMGIQRKACRDVVTRCKRAGVKVVAGGPLFAAEHERFDEVDHYVLNEAELTLPLFLADLENNRAKRVYETSAFASIKQTPVPAWELADLRQYASVNIQYSRGCPFDCEFCNVTALFGHKPRTKSVGQILAELDALYDAGWRDGVFFVDDNFIGNKGPLKTGLLPALIEWRKARPHITFYTEASINLADDPELMRMMVEAGFDTVFVGIETPNEAGLAECNKGQNLNRDLVADVKRMQRAGLQVQGGFIVGFDSDTPSIFDRQIDLIQKSGIVAAMVGLLQAIPGTRLFNRLKGEGRLAGESTGDNVDGTTNIIPRMNLDALREGYRKILSHIYAPKHYYERVRTFLREYRMPEVKASVRISDIRALLSSAVRLGVVGRERFHYWRLLAWTRTHRPELFTLAVRLAIHGHHFRKTCKMNVV